jgi:hypothetical protein
MATFSAEVYQNEYLPDGGTDVHAVVTVTCAGAGDAGQSGAGDAAEVVIVDTSGSMRGENIVAAQRAARAALDQVLDGVWFAVVAGNHDARLAYPEGSEPSMVRMDDGTRARAKAAVTGFRADGGTAMGTWLTLATRLFGGVPSAIHRHAILLTDGINQHETPEQLDAAIEAAKGRFQCDCRGVGSAWRVAEVRRIATALLGSIDLIAKPDQMAADFGRIMRQSMGRGVADASLRVWAPQDARVLFVRQVSPTVEDLTTRRQDVNPLTGAYPTGAWGDESRDYHLAVRVPAKAVGQEQLVARVQLAVDDVVVTQCLVKALWSGDAGLTARIDPAVAHYTGQERLAEAIQAGLAAKAAGDTRTAAVELGRAVRLAAETGNEEAASRLRKVVEVDDPGTGSVRLRGSIDKLDEMALDTASTKTTRVRK